MTASDEVGERYAGLRTGRKEKTNMHEPAYEATTNTGIVMDHDTGERIPYTAQPPSPLFGSDPQLGDLQAHRLWFLHEWHALPM
jgi:hypothetical protein